MIHKNYAENGDAKHYAENRLQAIIKYERIYGTLGVMIFCEITADKYRERLGKKDAIEQELIKINWYEQAAKYYFAKLGTPDEIIIDNRVPEPLPWYKEKSKFTIKDHATPEHFNMKCAVEENPICSCGCNDDPSIACLYERPKSSLVKAIEKSRVIPTDKPRSEQP